MSYFFHDATGFFCIALLSGFSGVASIPFFAPTRLDLTHRFNRWRAGGTDPPWLAASAIVAGWHRSDDYAAVCVELLVGIKAHSLPVAGDFGVWRSPTLGFGSQSRRINQHPCAKYRSAVESDGNAIGICDPLPGWGTERHAVASYSWTLLAVDADSDGHDLAAIKR